MKKARSLREKLIPTIFLASLLTIGLFAAISQVKLRGNIKFNLNSQALGSMEKSNQCLDLMLDRYETILYELCTNDDIVQLVKSIDRGEDEMGMNSGALRRELSHISNRNYGVKGILIRTAGGAEIFCDTLASSTASSQWIKDVEIPDVKKNVVYQTLKEPVRLGDEEIHLFQIARRLLDYRDIHRDVGTVVISVDESVLHEAIESGTNSRVYLCDGDTIIHAPDLEDIGRDRSILEDRDRMVLSMENVKTGWTIVSSHSLARYHKTVWEQAFYQFLIAVGIMALMTMLVHYITKPVVKSVDAVVDAMNAAETGDFSVRIPVEETMSRELQRIALGFNEMMGQIDELLKQVKQAMLDQKNAELAALEAQIDPHFLYNTLDTINWKAIENDQFEISEMVGALADILRYAVRNAGAETTVGQEISWLGQYMMLQSASLGKELETDIRAAEGAAGCRIHKLLLQPFVENAIKHGLAKKEGRCVLKIRIEIAGRQMHVTIEDNGRGMSKEALKRLNDGEWQAGNHLGVANVRQRLKLYYSDEAGLYFESRQNRYTRVHLFIPMRREGDDEDRDR